MGLFVPIIFVGATLLGLSSTGCSTKKAQAQEGEKGPVQKPSQKKLIAKKTKVPEKPAPQCGKDQAVYAFKHEEGSLTVCHQEDPRKADGIFQSASDKLSLIEGDKSENWQSKGFKQFGKKYRLPEFADLSVKQWHEIYQKVFPEESTLKEFQAFNELVDRAQKGQVDLDQAFQLAQKFYTPTINKKYQHVQGSWDEMSSHEKFLTLDVAVFLLDLQNNDHPFYQAKNAEGKQENKEFIDAIVKNIEAGKLGIKDIQGKKERFPHQHDGAAAFYNIKQNAILLPKDYLAEGGMPKEVLIHELFHFYQDIQKLKGTQQSFELGAFLKGAEFEVAHFLQKVSPEERQDPKALLEEFRTKNGPEKNQKDPGLLAAGMIFYLQQGDAEAAEAYRQKMITSLNVTYYLREMSGHAMVSAEKAIQQVAEPANVASFYAGEGYYYDKVVREAQSQKKHYLKLIDEQMEKGYPEQNYQQRDFLENLAKYYQGAIYATAILTAFKIRQQEFKSKEILSDEEWKKEFNQAFEGVYQTLAAHHPMQYREFSTDGV